jgi:hypothetical protein
MGGGLIVLGIVFFGFTLPIFLEGQAPSGQKVFALCLFWLAGIALTWLPFAFTLEVGDRYVRTSLLGFQIRKVTASNVELLEYGNLFRAGGLGMGKGLKIWEKTNNGLKYFSIGEGAYGTDAIADARRALQA